MRYPSRVEGWIGVFEGVTMMRLHLEAVAAAALAFAATSPAMAATVFADRASFEAAVGSTTIETFDEDIARATTITFANGVTATKSSDGIPPTLNEVDFGTYTGFVQRDGFRDITFDLGRGVTAFGADFTSGIANTSLMIMGAFDGVQQTLSIADTIGASGFFGVQGNTSFDLVTFRTNAGGSLSPGAQPFGGESFGVDNLTLPAAGPGVAPIPLPAAFGLMLGAMVGLGAVGRARRG